MDRKKSIVKNQIIGGFILSLFVCIVFTLVYKAQLEDSFDKKVYCTLMWEHKQNGCVELSSEKTSLTQVFTCTVPSLKSLRIESRGQSIHENTQIEISLTEPSTGKEYYYKTMSLSKFAKKGKKKFDIKLKKRIENSENKQLILNVSLIDAQDSRVKLTANTKPGIVTSFDGITENKTNVIYGMRYYNTKNLKNVYAAICVMLLVTAIAAYYLIVVRKKNVVQFYVPIAILMGLIMQCTVVVYGVPDEPWHMDTAYKLSNDLLFAEDTDIPGMIMKRQCDVVMSDMLANGVESNSYYQLQTHTFEKPINTELIMVPYTDSSNIVPDFIFLPTAIGISIGRLLGLSAMMTLQLGRVCNLIVFVIFTWLAIRRMPYGKNVMAALGFTPIALQQAASASYDPVITGMVFLYTATVMRMAEAKKISKKDIVLTAIIVLVLAMVKGSVYLPLVCILLVIATQKDIRHILKGIKKKWIVCGVAMACLLVAVMLFKFMPTISALMLQEVDASDMNAPYTLSYILGHPLNVIYLYWNTLVHNGAGHLMGMLGGKLGWHDIKMSWVLILIIFVSLLLLVHVEQDTYVGKKKSRICIGASCLVSIFLIMLSMLFACTTLGDSRILGIQGRYYLPLAPLLFMIASNSMIKVKREQSGRIWLTLVLVDVMVVLQFFVAVM